MANSNIIMYYHNMDFLLLIEISILVNWLLSKYKILKITIFYIEKENIIINVYLRISRL